MDEIPVVFATPHSLRALVVVAVATSLAACTTACFMLTVSPHTWTWTLVAGMPTLFAGALWAMLLRWRKTTARGLRWGWVASAPLAALNCALASGLFFASDFSFYKPDDGGSFASGAILGGTVGVIIWGPALIVVLVVFGLPIAHAQALAQRGLAGEERGERFVGVLSAALGAIALAIAYAARAEPTAMTVLWQRLGPYGAVALHAMSLVAVAAGSTAAAVATVRERRRRRFVERVEAREVPGFRVSGTPAGKVLLRVAPVATYRLSDVAEELFELDAHGSVTHAIHGSSRSQSA